MINWYTISGDAYGSFRFCSIRDYRIARELEEGKHSFLSVVLDTVVLNDIPPELIFNWDQTGINLVPSPLWTLDKKGKKRIDVAGHQDTRQITAVMCGSELHWSMMVILTGATLLMDWKIVHTENHWSNEQTVMMTSLQLYEHLEDNPQIVVHGRNL